MFTLVPFSGKHKELLLEDSDKNEEHVTQREIQASLELVEPSMVLETLTAHSDHLQNSIKPPVKKQKRL